MDRVRSLSKRSIEGQDWLPNWLHGRDIPETKSLGLNLPGRRYRPRLCHPCMLLLLHLHLHRLPSKHNSSTPPRPSSPLGPISRRRPPADWPDGSHLVYNLPECLHRLPPGHKYPGQFWVHVLLVQPQAVPLFLIRARVLVLASDKDRHPKKPCRPSDPLREF